MIELGQDFSGNGVRAALERGPVDVLCAEGGDNQRHHGFRHFGATAGEDVHRRVAVFRPCVDGHMAFRDDDDAANTLRREVMEVG